MTRFCCLFLSLIIFIQECLGSSCCGSSISMPALITTGEKWKFQTAFSESQRVFQISPDSEAIKLSSENQLSTFKTQIKMGYRFQTDWQIFSQFDYFGEGFGDFQIGAGRELFFIDDTKTFVWAQLNLPTGKSIYDMKTPQDVPTGSGFWTPGVGMNISKTFGTWDASTSVFIGKGFSNKIKGKVINPGVQTFTQISLGKSAGNWRLGGSLEYQREDGKKVTSEVRAEDSFSWPVGISLSYLDKGDIWTLGLTDETLLGPTKNTYLNQGISLSFVRRFF